MIYDYDLYNDLGNPDKSEDLARPLIVTHPVYVPRDETFEEIKKNTFSAGRLKVLLHNLVPLVAGTLSSPDISFTNFTDIDKLYNDGFVLNDDKDLQKNKFSSDTLDKVFSDSKRLLKYKIFAIF
ncbi:hypothetical protein P3S68_014877 [Capsicum galapagoense]